MFPKVTSHSIIPTSNPLALSTLKDFEELTPIKGKWTPELAELPKLVLFKVFNKLELNDMVSIALCCKRFAEIYQNNTFWKEFHDRLCPQIENAEPKKYYQVCTLIYNMIKNLTDGNYWLSEKTSIANLKSLEINLIITDITDGKFNFKNLTTGNPLQIDTKRQYTEILGKHILVSDEDNYRVLNLETNKEKKPKIDEMKTSALKCIDEHVNLFNDNKTYLTMYYGNDKNSEIIIHVGKSSNNFKLLVQETNSTNTKEEPNGTDKNIVLCVFDSDFQEIIFEKQILIDSLKTAEDKEYTIYAELSGNSLITRETISDKSKTNNKKRKLPTATINTLSAFDLNTKKHSVDLSSKQFEYFLCPTLHPHFVLESLNRRTITIYNSIKNRQICTLKDFSFLTYKGSLSLPPQYGLGHFLFVPIRNQENKLMKVEVLDLKQVKCFPSLKHLDLGNEPSEILQTERIDDNFITISKKTIKKWNTVEQKHVVLGTLENQGPYRPKIFFGNYIVDFDAVRKKISSWNVKTETSATFDNIPFGPTACKTAALGNLLAILFPATQMETVYQHEIHILDLETGGKPLFVNKQIDFESKYDIKFLKSGLLTLYPTHNEETQNLKIFKFLN